MATIKTAISLYDGVTGPMHKINQAVNTAADSFDRMSATANDAMNIGQFVEARTEWRRLSDQVDSVESSIASANNRQKQLNQSFRNGTSAADGLLQKVKNLAVAYGGTQAVSKLVGLSDQLTGTKARLNFLVDDGGSVAELEQKIMASAQRSRSYYLDTASAIASMGANAGSAFSGNDELIAFMEQVNKQFVIGGASAQGQSAAMLQLTQAMAAGALRGEELNSILENAPGIARAIESYMGVAEGSIKKYAEQGLITSEVVKNALFAAVDEVNAKFESMPMTWAQVWTNFCNTALVVLQPLLNGVNWLANNLEIIGPIVLGVGAAFTVFLIAANWTKIAAAAAVIYKAVIDLLNIAYGLLTGNTVLASTAAAHLNAVWLANPVVWVVGLILVLIGVLYACVNAYNRNAETAVSATGIIMGAFAVLGAHILNHTLIPIQRGFAAFANFLGNVFNDPIAAVKVLFYDMAITVLGYIANVVHGLETLVNMIPGVQVTLTTGIDSLYNQAVSGRQSVIDESGWKEYVKPMDYIDYSDAFSAGYDFGKGIDNKVKDFFSFDSSGFDYSGALADTAGNTADTAANTAKAANALDIAQEDLAYMKDIAERESINRYTTAEIVIHQNNENHIGSDLDLDGIMTGMTERIIEEVNISADGDHIS